MSLREPKSAERYFKPAAHAAIRRPHCACATLHTCASLLIREARACVQDHLGHKSASITLDRHLFPEEPDHLADRLERRLAQAGVHLRAPTTDGGLGSGLGPVGGVWELHSAGFRLAECQGAVVDRPADLRIV